MTPLCKEIEPGSKPFQHVLFVVFFFEGFLCLAGWPVEGRVVPKVHFVRPKAWCFIKNFRYWIFCLGQIFVLVALHSPKFGKFCFHDCPQKLTCTNIAHPMRRMICIFSGWTLQGVKFLIWTTFGFFWFWGSKLDTCQSDGYLPQASSRFQKSWEMILILECESGP